MGFGHRVYKNFDPRAKIIKRMAEEVFEVTGRNPLLDIALELERIALQDEYFVKRKLYPNVDFYSGLIYQAIGIPTAAFTVLFAIPRTSGWLAQWEELLEDPEEKIARPRQVYLGRGRAPVRSDGEALSAERHGARPYSFPAFAARLSRRPTPIEVPGGRIDVTIDRTSPSRRRGRELLSWIEKAGARRRELLRQVSRSHASS